MGRKTFWLGQKKCRGPTIFLACVLWPNTLPQKCVMTKQHKNYVKCVMAQQNPFLLFGVGLFEHSHPIVMVRGVYV